MFCIYPFGMLTLVIGFNDKRHLSARNVIVSLLDLFID